MKTIEITADLPREIPNSENLVQNFRYAIGVIGNAYARYRQRAIERALADAVVEQYYREAKQKAFELSMGVRSDQWKGH